MRIIRVVVAVLALLGVLTTPGQAQRGFAFSIDFGYTGVQGGNWGDVLTEGIHSEIIIDHLFSSGLIVGAGMYYVSYDLQPAFGDNYISNVQPTAILGYVFSQGKVRPYVQLKGTILRLRLQGHFEPTPPDEEGENTSPQRWGTGAVGAAGIEFVPWRHVTFDLQGWYGAFKSQEVDLTDVGGTTISEGRSYGVQLGIKWYPSP